MAASKRNTVGLILVLAIVGGAWAAEPNSPQKAPAPLSNTQYASCIVNITADPEIFPVTPQTVMNLIMSSAVGAKAARAELGIDDAAINKIFQALVLEPLTDSTGAGASDLHSRGRGSEAGLADITLTRPAPKPTIAARGPGGLETATLRIGVTLPNDVKPAAEEFLRATVDNLRLALRVAGDGYISQLHEMAAKAQDQRLGAQEELRKAMSEAGLDADADIQDLTSTRRGLEKELDSERMELALTKIKQEAIAKQIDLLRDKTVAKLQDDVVTLELQKIVQSSEAKVADMEKLAAGKMVSNDEVVKARENLGRARIELATRQAESSKAVSGGQLDSYSGELSQMAIQMAEREARIRLLEEQRDRVGKRLAEALAKESSLLRSRVRFAQDLADALDQRISDLRILLATLQPPVVTVIGAN